MKQLSASIKKYTGENPFGDYQARNFPDSKVSSEFYPINTFWSLFNDQHEILIGSRGSGKTILLKMMRNSMLKTICHQKSTQILSEKRFISLYVPMHLEFVISITTSNLSNEKQIEMFQVAFNCLLAQSMLSELKEMLSEEIDTNKQLLQSTRLVKQINEMWFNDSTPVYDFQELENKINQVFYSIDEKTGDISKAPIIFRKQICTPLLSVRDIITHSLKYNDPTWIICIDEAEFLTEPLLKCINSFFRSDSNRIALKIATLPFYHSTFETLKNGTFVSDGNDFNYRVIDMDYNSDDFKHVTNRICSSRLAKTIGIPQSETILEDFLGKVGNDDLVDYFRNEFDKKITNEQIEKQIIASFSDKKKKSSNHYTNKRKTIYDKYAPIYFLREMYKLSTKGNSKPGWYAGAKTVRRVAQGNPRMFIHLMNDMFSKAQKTSLTPKAQHDVVYHFAESFCKSTKAIESKGPEIYKELDYIANILKEKTHGKYLITTSSSFVINFNNLDEFSKNEDWIKLAIAHSRLFVDDNIKKGCLTFDTRFCLANVFSVVYWLPMRKDSPIEITINNSQASSKKISKSKKNNNTTDNLMQLSLFEDVNYD